MKKHFISQPKVLHRSMLLTCFCNKKRPGLTCATDAVVLHAVGLHAERDVDVGKVELRCGGPTTDGKVGMSTVQHGHGHLKKEKVKDDL